MTNEDAARTARRTAREATATGGALPTDALSWWGILILGLYFFGLAVLIFYLLVATWPVQNTDARDPGVFAAFSIFNHGPYSLPSDIRLFLTVIAAGAVGSLIHTLTSFADFVGNRSLSRSWIWWFILRTPVGIALAILFYLVLRGGLIVPSAPSGSATGGAPASDTTRLLNPYGIAAVSALAGMFSKQATDKLRKIFDTLFRTHQPVLRADPLVPTNPLIAGIEPAKLKVGGPRDISIIGRGFQRNCMASINGKPRTVQWTNDTRLVLTLEQEDISAAGQLNLIVENPGPDGGKSEVFAISVEAA
jgi:IPT/TIG domain